MSQGTPLRALRSAWILAAALALLLAGCTHAVPLTGNFDPRPGAARLPVAVGVYYSDEFATYEHAENSFGDRWVFPLGPASRPLIDQALAALFETSVPVGGRPPLEAGQPDVVAVVEPAIEGFGFTLPFLKTGTYTAEIVYRFTLYAPNGTPFASWSVTGYGAKPGEVGFEFARWPGEAADIAMADAAHKFVAGFGDVPEVRRWLETLGVPVARAVPGPGVRG